jgi:acetoacetate decarboxylase
MMGTGSKGSLFNMGSREARPLSAERVREEAFAMPIHGPM